MSQLHPQLPAKPTRPGQNFLPLQISQHTLPYPCPHPYTIIPSFLHPTLVPHACPCSWGLDTFVNTANCVAPQSKCGFCAGIAKIMVLTSLIAEERPEPTLVIVAYSQGYGTSSEDTLSEFNLLVAL